MSKFSREDTLSCSLPPLSLSQDTHTHTSHLWAGGRDGAPSSAEGTPQLHGRLLGTKNTVKGPLAPLPLGKGKAEATAGILACSMAWKCHGYESVNSNELWMNSGTNREAASISMTVNTPEMAVQRRPWCPPHFACYFRRWPRSVGQILQMIRFPSAARAALD